MKATPGLARWQRWSRRLAIGSCALLGIGGCSPTVRDVLFTGLQDTAVGLATALIDALFTGLLSGSGDGGSLTTVNAMFEELTRWLA